MAPRASSAVTSDPAIKVSVQTLPPLDRLEPMWRDLEARADRPFFLSWTWIGTWLKTIDCRPHLLIATSGDEVVGLALVHAIRMRRHRVMPVRTLFLHQTGKPGQDVITIEYNDILVDRRASEAIRGACLRFLIAQGEIDGKRVDEMVLGGIEDARLGDIEALRRPRHERARAGSAFVDLGGLRERGVTYLDSLSRSTRRRIKRSLALYRERGRIDVRWAETTDEALAFFEEAGQLHQARWTGRGHPGAFAHPYYVMFHRRLIRNAMSDGKVELFRVSVQSEPIGYLYNFLDRGRVYYYFSGFRFETDNRLKPGLVCHTLCIEQHLAEGMDVYDFMGGDQRYKLALGQPGPAIQTVAVQLPSWKLAAERPLRRLKRAVSPSRSG